MSKAILKHSTHYPWGGGGGVGGAGGGGEEEEEAGVYNGKCLAIWDTRCDFFL